MSERWSPCRTCKGLGFRYRKIGHGAHPDLETVECDECHGTCFSGRAEDKPQVETKQDRLDNEQYRNLYRD